MKCVVLVPGIQGSVLETPGGDQVWPPKPSEVVLGYGRLSELLREDLVSTDIIRKVSCLDVYEPLIDQINGIGFTEGSATQRLEIFHYDWRLDLEITARALADRLGALAAAGATEIAILAHSMGGLVARLVLEPETFRAEPWFDLVDTLFTLGTPHLGAPMALVRILGLEGDLGISAADFRTYAADHRYPSAYQLLPAPGEDACWNLTDSTLGPLNIYDLGDAQAVGLDPALVARVAWVHQSFAEGSQPPGVRYLFFGGAGHRTCTRINVAPGQVIPTLTDDAGDGTVPMWSAFGKATQKQLVRGEHSKFFRREEFSAVLYRLFGQRFPTPPVAAAAMLDLSVQALVLRPNEEIELLILSPAPTSAISGEVVVEFTADETAPFAPLGEPVPISYEGAPVGQLRVLLAPRPTPGHYRLSFAGSPSSGAPVLFSVVPGG